MSLLQRWPRLMATFLAHITAPPWRPGIMIATVWGSVRATARFQCGYVRLHTASLQLQAAPGSDALYEEESMPLLVSGLLVLICVKSGALELTRLQGKWEILSVHLVGVRMAGAEKSECEFLGNRCNLKLGNGAAPISYQVRIVTGGIDFVALRQDGTVNTQRVSHGIFRLRDHGLELCIGRVQVKGDFRVDEEKAQVIVDPMAVFVSDPRPTDFDPRQGDLIVLKRVPTSEKTQKPKRSQE